MISIRQEYISLQLCSVWGQKNNLCLGQTNPTLIYWWNQDFFSGFLKKYNLMHFERRKAFKIYIYIYIYLISKGLKYFFQKKKIINKKIVCLPYLKKSDPLP